jgi:FAD/FMN-containing dehydrogenase
MVLIGDIVGDDDQAVAKAASEVIRFANDHAGEGFVAISPEARKAFWSERARTAAIARHTNAFKINEDVVIPLPRMGEYTNAIEHINIELSISNKLKIITACGDVLLASSTAARLTPVDPDDADDAEDFERRISLAIDLLERTHGRWAFLLANLQEPVAADHFDNPHVTGSVKIGPERLLQLCGFCRNVHRVLAASRHQHDSGTRLYSGD